MMNGEPQGRKVVVVIGLSSLLVLAAAVAAPVFGWALPRDLLGAACHQEPQRCLAIGGSPMALCARCTAIFAGLLTGSGLVLMAAPGRPLALRLLVLAVFLTVLDVLAERTGFTSNLIAVRLVTGWLLGFAVVLMIGHGKRSEPRVPVPSPSNPMKT